MRLLGRGKKCSICWRSSPAGKCGRARSSTTVSDYAAVLPDARDKKHRQSRRTTSLVSCRQARIFLVVMSSSVHLAEANYIGIAGIRKDPVMDEWIFMSSPMPVMSIVLLYLCFVLKLGPNYMHGRKPFNLRAVLIVYNIYQIVFNAWLCILPFRYGAVQYIYDHVCIPIEKEETYFLRALSTGSWWFFFSRIVDLLDTVFFVMRKKQSKVTFLHVFHHTFAAIFSWGCMKILPGAQVFASGYLNCLVHFVMYFYYLVAAFGPKYRKFLWWKKYVTCLQLFQFCLVLIYNAYVLAYDCKLPKVGTYLQTFYGALFLFLFSRFYRETYMKKKQATE